MNNEVLTLDQLSEVAGGLHQSGGNARFTAPDEVPFRKSIQHKENTNLIAVVIITAAKKRNAEVSGDVVN